MKFRDGEYYHVDENAVLQCQNVSRTYFQGDEHIYAVNSCTLSVKKGEFISIVGASGSGKSTLLHMMAGLDTPTSGKIYVNGTDMYGMKDSEFSAFRNEKIGIIFQSYNLLPVLTAKENILMPQKISGKKLDKRYFDMLTELLGIGDRLNHLPSEMSGGQQQRVAVARALINKPSIVFADEPTGNLDKRSADELTSLLLKTREELGQTLVVVTHDTDLASLADKVYVMDSGVLGR